MGTEQIELMSSLYLCAILTLFPAVLGESIGKTDWEVKFNVTKMIRQKPSTHKKILLNINGPPLVNMISELQFVFGDHACHKCIECMEKAIKAYKNQAHLTEHRPTAEEIQNDVLSNLYKFDTQRKKRDVDTKPTITETGTKKSNTKKNKQQKSVTVAKYNIEGEIYALKVKEIYKQVITDKRNDTSVSSTSCQLYGVKKSFPCGTPEGDLMLALAKRKVNKKNKRDKDKNKNTGTTEKSGPIFRKRQVDNTQVPETFMPSIEEMY